MSPLPVASISAVLLALVPWISEQPAAPGSITTETVKLSRKKYKKPEWILCHGLEGDVPTQGFEAKIGRTKYLFFDIDGDAKLEPTRDGIALPDHRFVVPIPEVLLDRTGQFGLSFEGTKVLQLAEEDLGELTALVEAAAFMTEVRISNGLSPITLSPEASAHCDLHADYLKARNLHGGAYQSKAALSLHDEDPSHEAYTPEGAAAGKNSCLGFQKKDYEGALSGWLASAYHRWPLLDPHVTSFGATVKHEVVAYYDWEREGRALDGPQVTPNDHARGVPLEFCLAGEAPNPVPGTEFGRGCGYPVTVRGVQGFGQLVEATLLEGRKRKPVPGSFSCPRNPASELHPSNAGCATFIPRGPLKSRTTYEATFKFAGGKELTWSFETAGK
jgi:hypothetical protein